MGAHTGANERWHARAPPLCTLHSRWPPLHRQPSSLCSCSMLVVRRSGKWLTSRPIRDTLCPSCGASPGRLLTCTRMRHRACCDTCGAGQARPGSHMARLG